MMKGSLSLSGSLLSPAFQLAPSVHLQWSMIISIQNNNHSMQHALKFAS